MKSRERKTLQKLNRFFLTDILIEDDFEYNRFDAENNVYITEIKNRNKHYDDILIEFDKYSYNILYANHKSKKFIYVVSSGANIYVFNITELVRANHNFNWEWRDMPKQTEFSKTEKTKKFVGYINVNFASKIIPK